MRILYVEDNPVDGDLARRWLQRYAPQYSLDTVGTQAEALERLGAGEHPAYEVVLTDLHLPDGDGLSLLREIRKRSLPLAVTVITGAGSEDAAVRALRAGADDYVVKEGSYLQKLPVTLENAYHRHRADAERMANPLRILYAEHDRTDIELTVRHFEEHAPHSRLDVVTDGRAALERLTNGAIEDYDVCLLDYRMPGLDGLGVLKHLRDELRIDMPIVLITGQGDDEVMLQALRLGAAGYVIKEAGYLYRLPAELERAHYRSRLEKDRAALEESRERVARAEAFAHVMTALVDLEGRFIQAPPTLAVLLGYAPDELLALSCEDIVHAGDREDGGVCEALLRNGKRSQSAEVRLVRADGTIVWCFINCSLVTDERGEPIHFLVYMMDITQRKQAEVALRDSESRTRAVLSAVPDLMFVQTPDGLITDYFANDPDALLVPPETFLGKNILDVLPPDVAPGLFECLRSARDTGKPQMHEYRLNIRGEDRYFESRMVLADTGNILSIIREITERRRAELALEKSRDRIRLLAGRLIAAQEEERTRIANELHDDLSQRMAALSMNLSRLRQRMAGSTGPDFEFVSKLESQAAALADSTRALSRQLHSAVLEHIGLRSALESFCADFTQIVVHLEIGTLANPLPQPVQLCVYRVVQESLHNAARHSGASDVSVKLGQSDSFTELTVADDGEGFDPDIARTKGGLGLISLEERVRLVGGTFDLDTAPGRGTRVIVRIPLS